MKKMLLLSAALGIFSVSFSQTEKAATTTQPKKTTEKAKAKSTKKGMETEAAMKNAPKSITDENVALSKEAPTTVQQIAPVKPAETPAPAAPMLDPNKDFEFTNDAYDFGKIPAGKPAKYVLSIKNTSSEQQELTLVQPGCGCTTPEYTQNQKFGPGETIKVTLGFNGGSPSSSSPFSKSVTVTLKGHNPKVVTFRGETFAVPAESAPANNATDKLKPAGK